MVLYQAAACLSLVQNQTTFVHLPTGSGKSLIWLLASLALATKGRSGITLVIFPLVALLRDQFRRITQMKFDDDACVIIDKDTTNSARDDLYRRLDESDPTLRFLFMSSAMLVTNSTIFNLLAKNEIMLMVFDEYDTLITWKGFYQAMNFIVPFTSMLLGDNKTPIAFLSATGTNDTVKRLSCDLNLESPMVLSPPQVRPFIHLDVRLQADPSLAAVVKVMANWINEHRDCATPVIIFLPFPNVIFLHFLYDCCKLES